MKKVKLLISTFAQHLIIKTFCENFKVWFERNQRRMNGLFLAIKFKIRFKMKFYKKYGFEYKPRIINTMRRHFSFLS